MTSLPASPAPSSNPGVASPSRLTLKPTELQPREVREFSSATAELRDDITALAYLPAAAPAFGAHLTLALQTIGRRLDALQGRLTEAGL